MTMKFISLFAGIGGFDLGLERAGMECVAQVEIEDFPTKILEKHWPDVPKFRDVRDVGKHNLPTADLICGGFPCQPHSTSGKRLASEDERDLWGEYARIIGEIKPRWVVAENVSGLLSSENGRFFSGVLRDLAQLGYDAEWHTVTASSFGFNHIRKRLFTIAHTNCDDAQTCRPIINENLPVSKAWTPMHHDRLFTSPWNDHKPNDGDVRAGDGVPNQLHRFKGLGNAVVPQVAEFVGRCILQAEAVTT